MRKQLPKIIHSGSELQHNKYRAMQYLLQRLLELHRLLLNKNINPKAQTIGVLNDIDPPHIVAIHENILIPVGTAMIAAKKYALVSVSKPTVYMW